MTYIEAVRIMAKSTPQKDLFGNLIYQGLSASEVEEVHLFRSRNYIQIACEIEPRPFTMIRESETVTWLLHD